MDIAQAINRSQSRTSIEVAFAGHGQQAISEIAASWSGEWDYHTLASGTVEAWGWDDDCQADAMAWRIMVKIAVEE